MQPPPLSRACQVRGGRCRGDNGVRCNCRACRMRPPACSRTPVMSSGLLICCTRLSAAPSITHHTNTHHLTQPPPDTIAHTHTHTHTHTHREHVWQRGAPAVLCPAQASDRGPLQPGKALVLERGRDSQVAELAAAGRHVPSGRDAPVRQDAGRGAGWSWAAVARGVARGVAGGGGAGSMWQLSKPAAICHLANRTHTHTPGCLVLSDTRAHTHSPSGGRGCRSSPRPTLRRRQPPPLAAPTVPAAPAAPAALRRST
jgi:hypothetical protein